MFNLANQQNPEMNNDVGKKIGSTRIKSGNNNKKKKNYKKQ
jgi:hypothetical protein